MKESKDSQSLSKQTSFSVVKNETILPPKLANRFELYPENKRRPVNKTVFKNEYFQLTYNVKENNLNVSSKGDLIYSAIPYDTARNYIQRAAIQYLLYPEEVHQYIKSHKGNLETYLKLSIFQVTGKRVNNNSSKVIEAYNAIFEDPLLEIQILGRLLQHDETGALSANLAGKFLFSENVKTGISGYVSEYLKFVVELTQTLPIMTDGKQIQFLESGRSETLISDKNKSLSFNSEIKPALTLLPQEIKQELENAMVIGKPTLPRKSTLLLRSEVGKELSDVRKNYHAHSVDPRDLEVYFENIHPTENTNLVNVISDIHTSDGKLPFMNQHFNILAGDISDSQVVDTEIEGLYVIGNHELADVLPNHPDKEAAQWDQWRPFFTYEWFQKLMQNPDDSWYLLPTGNHIYYECVKAELEKRFPKMQVLNNDSLIHNGIRYIGLTIPVVLAKRKKEQQTFLLHVLEYLLGNDYSTPTVIVSHAPLFNELSMLSPKSKSYNKGYDCSEPNIEKLFSDYNIIGAIHGHHHIPASSGRYKFVSFAGKELFLVCSIYSKMNTGFDLMHLIQVY